MATRLGLDPHFDISFGAISHNAKLPELHSAADFAAQSAVTGVRGSSANLAARPGGAAVADRFLQTTDFVYHAFTQAGVERAAYRATLTHDQGAAPKAAAFTQKTTPSRGGPSSGPSA